MYPHADTARSWLWNRDLVQPQHIRRFSIVMETNCPHGRDALGMTLLADERRYFTLIRSTSNISVAPGGMSAPAPLAP